MYIYGSMTKRTAIIIACIVGPLALGVGWFYIEMLPFARGVVEDAKRQKWRLKDTIFKINERATMIIKAYHKPYFDFDEIDHYFLNISRETLSEIEQKKTKTYLKEKQSNWLRQYGPDSLPDAEIDYELTFAGYVKKEVPSAVFPVINDIFCERPHEPGPASGCIPEFRDILLFKKEKQLVGLAKICFTCHKHSIIDTNLNTSEFGQSGDYEKLFNILH